MKNPVFSKGIFILVTFLFFGLVAKSQTTATMKYQLVYNLCSNKYEVHFVAQTAFNLNAGNLRVAGAGVGIVLPASAVDQPLTVTSVNGGTWSDPSQVFNYSGSDFHKVINTAAPISFPSLTSIPAGTDILLFTFTIGTQPVCVPGVRLFYGQAAQASGSSCSGVSQFDDPTELTYPLPDPCSNEMPGNSDYRSSFRHLLTATETYRGNIENTGTACTGFDFGDLTTLWGSARAAIISPDCDNNGVPDGNGGAVWAGDYVDAEKFQNFSADPNLANGDDLVTVGGRNDEDGLLSPVIPLTFGYSYDFIVKLNSNQTGKTVHYGLWFDWNNNGNFNDDVDGNGMPAFYSGSGVTNSPVLVPVNVKIPIYNSNISLARYKARLIVSDVAVNSSMFNATIANGEIEDFQAPSQILPVTFGNLTAEAKNCSIHIAFDYLTQQNNKEFQIEYSANGNTWQQLATLSNTGNISATHYSYVHTLPAAGANYYRIKQIDVNGNFSYSKTVIANSICDGRTRIVTYPNPVHTNLTVVLPSGIGKSQLRITDAAGKLVSSTTTQTSFNTINTSMLAGGLYQIQVYNAEKMIYTTKFVKE